MKQIQRRALAEPLELRPAERVIEAQRLGDAVRVFHTALHGLAGRHVRQPDEADAIVLAYAVVVRGILERQCQQALLLEVGLVNAGKAAHDYRRATEKTR